MDHPTLIKNNRNKALDVVCGLKTRKTSTKLSRAHRSEASSRCSNSTRFSLSAVTMAFDTVSVTRPSR